MTARISNDWKRRRCGWNCHSGPAKREKNPRICAATIIQQIVTTLLLATSFASAQTPTGLYRIAGTAISSADGHPLSGASISIRSEAAPKQITENTTSDEDGRFQFTGLPAGNFTLQGESRNFLLTYYDDHDGFTTGIITGSSVATDALVLKLVPKASLSGAVVNEAGEPVPNAAVRLFRQSHSFGDDRIVSAGTQQTDDLGRFEFVSLEPADYLVAVTAQPWYAVHPQPPPVNQIPTIPANMPADQQQYMRRAIAQMQRQAVFGVTGPLDPSLDVAYPVTYYPRGTDSTEAEPIPLRPGDSREISLQLSPVQAVSITFPRAPEPPLPYMRDPQSPEFQAYLAQMQRQQQQIPQLRISIFGNLEPATTQMQSGPNGTMISGLAPGDYVIGTNSTPANSQLGATPLHLTSSDRTLAAALPDTSNFAHVHVKLESANGAAAPTNVPVGLIRAGSNELISRGAPAKGDIVFDVPPGDYSFSIQPNNQSGRPNARFWFLRNIAADGKPLAANSIHLAAGDSPAVTLTIIPGDHTIRGIIVHSATTASTMNSAVIPSEGASAPESRDPRISSNSPQTHQGTPTPAPGVFLLLVPTAELKTEHRRFWRQQSDLDGSFSIAGLAPGSYTLFAIDDGWTLDWQQPGALDRYFAAAAQITIPDNAPPTISLPQPILAQPK